jgi:5-methylcytosine-specific restriction endonuclease McrA
MLKLFARGSSTVDHIVPVDSGGRNERDNLVTACNDCNIRKNNRLDDVAFEPKEIPTEIRIQEWDGFALLYPKLSERPDPWTRAILRVYANSE